MPKLRSDLDLDVRTRPEADDRPEPQFLLSPYHPAFIAGISYGRDDGLLSTKLKLSGDGIEQGCACRSPLIGDHVIACDWQPLIVTK